MAAGWLAGDPVGGRGGVAGGPGGRHRRRVPGSGLRRAGHTGLGRLRAGHAGGPDARDHACACRPGRAGGDRLAIGRRVRRDVPRCAHSPARIARGRRCLAQQSADAVAGGFPGRAGGAPAGDGDHGAGRCLPGWPGDRVLERRRRDRRAVGGRSPLRTAAGRGRADKLARWREAVERSKGWARP